MEIKKICLYKDKGCIRKCGFRPLNQVGFPTWDPREDALIHHAWTVLTIPNPCIYLPSRPCPAKHMAQRRWERIPSAGLSHRRDRMRPSWIFSVTSRIYQIVHSTFSEREWGRVPREAQDIAVMKSPPLRNLKPRVWCPSQTPETPPVPNIILCTLYVCGTCRSNTLWQNENKNAPRPKNVFSLLYINYTLVQLLKKKRIYQQACTKKVLNKC